MVELTKPVAFLIFNRPQQTQRVFEAIRAARPMRLLVVADGPRADRVGESERCAQTRAIVDRIDWPCEVQRNFAETNLGCKRRIASGLTWVFQQVEEAIVLEDDCLPHASFFPYCAELLDRYRNDPRVMAISGDNFGFEKQRNNSYYFSRYVHVWGWASWRRAWNLYDVEMKLWPIFRDGGWLADLFANPRDQLGWRTALDATFQGKNDTWDYQLSFAAFINHMLAIVPTRNLVTNIGFGADATHTGGHVPYANLALETMELPLKHPPFMTRNVHADQQTQEMVYSPPRLLERVRRKIIRITRSHD